LRVLQQSPFLPVFWAVGENGVSRKIVSTFRLGAAQQGITRIIVKNAVVIRIDAGLFGLLQLE
jgi:hypothetical protein